MRLLEHLTHGNHALSAKQNRKNIYKHWKGGSPISGERLYLDISSIKVISFGSAKFWALVVDDYLGNCWSYLLRAKSELQEEIIDLIKELKNVRFLRVDNAGDNFVLEKLCKQQNVDVKFV
jgi:hypothetical protein